MCVWAWLHPEGFFVKNHRENATSGARSWKMRIFLVWTLFLMRATSTGGWAVTGPKQVTVEQGSSLAVSCSYKPRYKLNSKYWCRKSSLWPCLTSIIRTDGSEVTVTQDRVSIRDNHTENSFTVTLSSVTPGDAGQYSCGVKKVGINRWHSTKVMVSAAVSNTTEDSNLSPLTTNPLCPRGCGEPPVLSQPSVIHLLLLLSIKVPMALAVVAGAAWVRSRGRSRDQEILQLLEASSSTRTQGCPPIPNTSEPQGRPPAPLAPTLLGPCHPSRLPRAGSCSDPGTSGPGKPRPLLAAPALQREGFEVQRACVC
ncbi:protein CD300H-like [Agelaius tricolor]|uniref:protein CD300H-like n=1 Tax=Agelaius tricolor TaxID=9191 RepID=UPI0039F221F8